jgi:hypothetical protein
MTAAEQAERDRTEATETAESNRLFAIEAERKRVADAKARGDTETAEAGGRQETQSQDERRGLGWIPRRWPCRRRR